MVKQALALNPESGLAWRTIAWIKWWDAYHATTQSIPIAVAKGTGFYAFHAKLLVLATILDVDARLSGFWLSNNSDYAKRAATYFRVTAGLEKFGTIVAMNHRN